MLHTSIPVLGVNVDHVATLRQARLTRYPDPVHAAHVAELAGAGQITIHLREDRRHIQDRDVRVLRETIRSRMNLEMGATAEMLAIALQTRPAMVTLVPEKREERTTEGGLDVAGQLDALTRFAAPLLDAGIIVSLFIDPDERQVDASRATGATMIELHTGDYAEAAGAHAAHELDKLAHATRYGKACGLTIAAGHGLDYHNLAPLVAAVPDIVEYNIGHSIVARAVFSGLEQAVRDMVTLIRDAALARQA